MAERRVPRIRFKGFEEDWEQRKLKELANRVIVGLATSVTPYYREQGVPILRNLNIKENHLDDSDLLYLDGMYADKQNSKKIRTGDVLTVHTGYIGTSCVVPPQYDNCLTFTTLVTTTNSLKILGDFLSQYLNSQFGMLAVQMVTTQGGRQNLNTNDFVQVEMSYPFIAEQKKICEILSTLDSLLSLHQRKLEKLKILKKAMLEKMFPKNGAKVPEIRFSGFTEDWEQRKVSELADRYDNLRVPVAEKLRVRGTTPYYGANGIQDYVRGFTHDGEFVLVAEDGANDLKNYPVQYVNGRIWVNNHAHVLQAKDKIADTRFLGYAVSRADIEAILVGGGRAKLNAEVLMRLALILPGRTEQIRLASFLVGIDSLLSLHQRKLEKLRQIKKSMLERMFV